MSAEHIDGLGLRVLVADDNFNNRQLVADILESSGYVTLQAASGPETLQVAINDQPDMIILDINMPGMNGFDVCANLKSNSHTLAIPILMLTALSDAENRVRGLELGADDYLVKPFNPRELIERVRARLRSKVATDELRQTQHLMRRTFERFVPAPVVDRLLRDPSQIKLGGQLQEVTTFFSDLENFTSLSERTEPERLLSMLNTYHTHVVSVIQQFGGTIDKFMGDAVMALFNTPLPQPDHAERAVMAALSIRNSLPEFYDYAQFETANRMRVNFGIHTGMAVVGNVGAPEIMDFSAVGDSVNLAARLQEMSHDGQILISDATYALVSNIVVAEPIGRVNVKGRTGTVMTYNVIRPRT